MEPYDPRSVRDPFGPVPFGHEEVLRGRSKSAVRESALVLQAKGIPHVVQAGGAGARILVTALDADRARHELEDYVEENEAWPPERDDAPPILTSGVPGAVAFALVITLMYPIGQNGAFGMNWWESGLMNAGSVAEDGAWWRTFTALTLHVDAQHLVSNLVFGSLFGVLAAQTLGTGLAWFGTVLAGAGGNLVESFLTDPSHRAVGASTAIFGTLGIMVASEWTRRGRERLPLARRLAPIFGGAVLFGWLGVGDGSGRVDVLAHATGFAVGALIGVAYGRLNLAGRVTPSGQRALAVLAVAALAASWAVALTR
ncbi:MAG: rhomboid family intramembrane serine protease [Planctomycetota bacterium]